MTGTRFAIRSLEITKLSCVRGPRALFRNLNFVVVAGQAMAIHGPNGSGKTSLLRMIAGFIAPAAGSILLKSDTEVFDSDERARQVGWLGHADGAKSQLTPKEVLSFYARLYGRSGDVTPALRRAGLERCVDLPCQYLSAGQKRRLALARLAVVERPLWLLDEPFAALDSAGKIYATELIEAHRAAGGMALVATHETLALASEQLHLGEP